MTILNLEFGSCEEGCNENSSIELFMLKILKGREMKVHWYFVTKIVLTYCEKKMF